MSEEGQPRASTRVVRQARIIDDTNDLLAKASDIRMHILPEGGTFDPRRGRVRFPLPPQP